jgi:hypothetical protein
MSNITLGENCFLDCSGLVTITIPSDLTSLPAGCFKNCSSLTSIIIPSSVTIIGNDFITGCSNLTNITFQNPSTITSMGTIDTSTLPNNFSITYNILNYFFLPEPLRTFTDSISNTSISVNYVYSPLGNVCFPAGTKIYTDQGIINIENIIPNFNTIRNNMVIGITQTYLTDNFVILIKKDSLYPNVPNRDTLISKNHKIFYKGNMYTAYDLSKFITGISKVKYNNYPMYNVILDKYEYMNVNNLIAETLEPNNPIAFFFINKNKQKKTKTL